MIVTVSTSAELVAVLRAAAVGEQILLQPGGLRDFAVDGQITISSSSLDAPAA